MILLINAVIARAMHFADEAISVTSVGDCFVAKSTLLAMT